MKNVALFILATLAIVTIAFFTNFSGVAQGLVLITAALVIPGMFVGTLETFDRITRNRSAR